MEKAIELAKHAIGLDRKKTYKRHGKYFYKPYRNYFAASQSLCSIWDGLVAKGYAKAGKKERGGGRIYWLTREGLDWLGKELNITIHDEEE